MKRIPLLSTAVLILAGCGGPSSTDVASVRNYISGSWEKTVCYNPTDNGSLLGLPNSYTVPTPEGGMFQEMYYWDTFFTNEGLIADNRADLARNNTENLLSMVERFGFVPNGSRTWYLSRSQPPYLSLMVAAVYGHYKDKGWLRKVYPTLEKEYAFWMSERLTPCGLNRYAGTGADQSLVDEFVVTGGKRLQHDFNADGLSPEAHEKLGRDFTAEAESGWDFNPRFDRRCGDFCPVDLNSLLYGMECNMAFFASELGLGGDEAGKWTARSESRKALMDELLWDPRKEQFFDYDYVNGCRSDVVSAAVFSTLQNKVASPEQAAGVVKALKVLEFKYGVSACEDKPYAYEYQWSFPNCWPPMIYVSVSGLMEYGYTREARRIARKYAGLVVKSYKATGTLWEKYNVVEGVTSSSKEYNTPEMFGWSAGAFIHASNILK